eukprot:4700569-Alexandrium_andersonii.AAC.1
MGMGEIISEEFVAVAMLKAWGARAARACSEAGVAGVPFQLRRGNAVTRLCILVGAWNQAGAARLREVQE